MRRISTPLTDVAKNIGTMRETLHDAQEALKTDRMNINKIQQVKQHSKELIKWQEMEFNMLKQREKIDWLWLCDGNNKYFHTSIKARHQFKNMKNVQKIDGTYVNSQRI